MEVLACTSENSIHRDVTGKTASQGVKFHPWNVLQYYHASTFALAHPSYNNTYAPSTTCTASTIIAVTVLCGVMFETYTLIGPFRVATWALNMVRQARQS
jgi:hypothetical protein